METPDITPIQKLVAAVVSVIASLLTVLQAFGVPLTMNQSGALLGFFTTLGAAFVIADAVIRNGRSRSLANPNSIHALSRPGAPSVND